MPRPSILFTRGPDAFELRPRTDAKGLIYEGLINGIVHAEGPEREHLVRVLLATKVMRGRQSRRS